MTVLRPSLGGRRGTVRRTPRAPRVVAACSAAALLLAALFLFCRAKPKKPRRPVTDAPRDPSLVLVTGYCNCEACCSWFGFGPPVYAAGPLKGKPKRVGVTASGTTARKGTVAADPKVWRFGTKLAIPGYGDGVVEDLGGAIRGRHIDVWFPTHAEARKWGRRWLKVTPR